MTPDTCTQTDKHPDSQTHTHTRRQTSTQTQTHTHTLTDKHPDSDTHTHTHTQSVTNSSSVKYTVTAHDDKSGEMKKYVKLSLNIDNSVIQLRVSRPCVALHGRSSCKRRIWDDNCLQSCGSLCPSLHDCQPTNDQRLCCSLSSSPYARCSDCLTM